MEKFHEKLKFLRKKQGLTQKDVADLVHVNRVTYTNWEKGEREPSFENISMLACIFDVSIDYLLSEYIEISKERLLKLKAEEYFKCFSFYIKQIVVRKDEDEVQETISNFGIKLKLARQFRNLTQEELAGMLGVTKKTIINYEKGFTIPSFDFIAEITRLLGFEELNVKVIPYSISSMLGEGE